ncbi:MAG: hypothetical protein ACP5T3_03350 [Candidatus Micrarchaeia archaeon]
MRVSKARRKRVAFAVSLVFALALLFAAFFAAVLSFANFAAAGSYASAKATVVVQGFVSSSLNVGIKGNGINESVPLRIIGRCFVQTQINGSIAVPRGYNSTSHTLIEPCNVTSTVVFSSLRPFSTYVLYVTGSESPYCLPGMACPFFILRVNYKQTLHTGPAGSIVNATFSV